MSNPQPSPELLTHVGHALLRSIATGQGDQLRHAADSLERLADLLPGASAECRLTAVLMSLTAEPTPREETMVQTPPPPRARRKARDKASQPAKASRKSKAALPVMDASGRLQPSRRIGDVDVVSQSTARQALGVSCAQMLRLEDQHLLERVQEAGLRHVWYPTQQVQKLLNLLDRGADPEPDADDVVGDPMA